MFKNRLKYLILLILLVIPFFSFSQNKLPKINNGVLILNKYDFQKDGNITLSGNWEFYWSKFYTPQDFKDTTIKPDAYAQVPGVWTKLKINGKQITDTGFATYRLLIYSDTSYNPGIIIFFREVLTAYKVYFNGLEISNIGTVGKNSTDAKPKLRLNLQSVLIHKGQNELIVQVSNYDHRTNGFDDPPIIGEENGIDRTVLKAISFDLIIFGLLLIMSFYHLGLWWLRKKNKVALTFAIFSAVMALRTVVFNNYLLSYVFPQLSWQIMYILAYSTLYAGVPIFLVYFRQTFEEKRFKIIFISNYIISLFFLLTLCLKSIIYTKLLMYYQAIALIYIVLLTILLISYSIKKKKGARILLLSITIFATTVINDILFYNDLIKTISLVPLGTFIMLLGQALTLGRIFTNSFEQNEILADKLEIQNKNLESIVEQRTKQLKEQNEELTVTEEELRQTLDEFKTLNRQFELKNIELKKYFTAIEQSNIAFLITDLHNKIEYVNSFFTTITGYTKEEVIGKNPRILNSGQNPKELYTGLWSKILNGEVWQGEFVNKAKDGHVFIEKAIITPLFNEGVITNYITIKEDITELRKQEIEISEKNNKLEHLNTEVNSILKDLMSSLSYAKKIQKSVFPSTEELTNILHDYFLFYKPREIVGGDFYFVRQIDNMKIIAVGDCTGHGVPGCFLTILATSLLIEYTNKIDKLSPAEILENIRKRVITFFSTDKNKIQDGFDLGLIVENTETKILTFAGANISAITYQNNELIEYKAVKSPIGYYPIQRNFENQTIPIKDNLMLYLASDGFIDQFDEHNNKFSKKQFKDLLSKIALLPLEVQNQEIVNSFIKWKGNFRQIDDITVLGIKF